MLTPMSSTQQAPPPLSIASDSLILNSQAAKPYCTFLTAEGGLPFVYRWSLTWVLCPKTGAIGIDRVISGTPSQAGTFQFTVQ